MYIKDCFAISPQKTSTESSEEWSVVNHNDKVYLAIEPNYLEFIPAGLLRRMGKAVRMGIGAALPLVKRNKPTNGIIIGTANGGLENCIDFLNQIVKYEEGRLTPTNFVQSTPNALAGQIALMTENIGYNSTHVNGAFAFENALMDGEMYFEEQAGDATLLIGAVEEISEYNYNIDLLAGRYKKEVVSNCDLLESKTSGTVCGEGATMFIVSNNPGSAIGKIHVNRQLIRPSKSELKTWLEKEVVGKLNANLEDCLLLTGRNGDIDHDHWYDFVEEEIFQEVPKTTFKNLCGEYRTSIAFALYLGIKYFGNEVSELVPNNLLETKKPYYLIIYNHFDGIRHSVVVIENLNKA